MEQFKVSITEQQSLLDELQKLQPEYNTAMGEYASAMAVFHDVRERKNNLLRRLVKLYSLQEDQLKNKEEPLEDFDTPPKKYGMGQLQKKVLQFFQSQPPATSHKAADISQFVFGIRDQNTRQRIGVVCAGLRNRGILLLRGQKRNATWELNSDA